MTDRIAYKYRAFISYSHADTRWAKWLHRALEGFVIDKDLAGRETGMGPVPKSLRPIFRDREDFTAGHTLGEQTLAALDQSHALIVLCSPKSAQSRYVNEEIRLFRQRHPARPVIPMIVDGKPGGGDEECFAPALRFKLLADGSAGGEPEPDLLAADTREEGDGRHLALAKVAARLLGLSTDDVSAVPSVSDGGTGVCAWRWLRLSDCCSSLGPICCGSRRSEVTRSRNSSS